MLEGVSLEMFVHRNSSGTFALILTLDFQFVNANFLYAARRTSKNLQSKL